MRRRQCKVCGKVFQGEGTQRLCPDCRAAAKKAAVVRTRTCITCGSEFSGGPRATYCPECREIRKKQQTREYRERKAAHKTREIGSTDLCQSCGKPYAVESGLQRYCPDCAEMAIREKVLPRKRALAAEHRADMAARKKALVSDSAICAYCGRTYTPTGPSVTCSPECGREYRRIRQGLVDYQRGRRKELPSHERYSSGLPQSNVVGVSYNRIRRKWEARKNGKYIGIFPTKEEAEKAVTDQTATNT